MNRHLSVVLVLALSAGCAGALPPGSVVPGLRTVMPRPSGPDTVVYRRTITQAGHDSVAGTRTVVRRVVGRFLEVVQRFPGGGGEIVDTAVADLRTLRAVAHRSHQPRKTMRFDFVGDSALGTVVPLDGAGEAVHQGLGGPIFDSNLIDLVVAALPLAPDFSTEVPFFIYERGGRVPMAVRVTGRARQSFHDLGERDAWVVSVGVPGAPATIWVDAATRAVLRVRYDITAAARSFTDERITPLAG